VVVAFNAAGVALVAQVSVKAKALKTVERRSSRVVRLLAFRLGRVIMRVQFLVHDLLPPKKTGGASMWSKLSQAPRLIHLRQAAYAAFDGYEPFEGLVQLTLTVHIGAQYTRRKGDLDSYLAGVCNGLMRATSTTHLASIWSDHALTDIHPYRAIAIQDDYQITRIVGEKIFGTDTTQWYEVILEEL
jgi:hypothetical protein